MNSYKDLQVWQKGMQLVLEIYRMTGKFPDSERFGLISQMRRAAVSIVANIAEGYGRGNPKENRQFINISYGSALELETHVIIAKQLGFVNDDQKSVSLLQEVQKMLYRYRQYLQTKF